MADIPSLDEFPGDHDIISRFRWLMYCIYQEFKECDVTSAEFLLKDKLEGNVKINNSKDLFDALENDKLISPDDLEFLKKLLKSIDRCDLLGKVEEYEKNRPVVIHIRDGSSFIGRKLDIDELRQYLWTVPNKTSSKARLVKGVFITGFPGVGKTTLAQEVVSQPPEYHRNVFIDLRGLTDIESIFFSTMNGLGKNVKEYDHELLIQELSRNKEPIVLTFDNADQVFQPDQQELFMEPFLDLCDKIFRINSKHLKLIVTSRNKCPLKHFYEKDLGKMVLEDSVLLISHYSGYQKMSSTDTENLARKCGFHPLAMKIVSSRLKYGLEHVSPKRLIKELSKRPIVALNLLELKGIEDQGLVEASLESSCEELPESMGEMIIMLSTIPGPFDVECAKHIVDKTDEFKVRLDLQVLCGRNLLEYSEESKKYKMHLLLQAYIKHVKTSNKEKKLYKDAQLRFLVFFTSRLTTIAKMLETDHVQAFHDRDCDLTNYNAVLDMQKLSTKDFNVVQFIWIEKILEIVFSCKGRQVYCCERAKTALKDGNMTCFITMKIFELQALRNNGESSVKLQETIDEITEKLQLLKGSNCKHLDLLQAQFHHYYGNIVAGENTLQDVKYAIGLLKLSIKVFKRLNLSNVDQQPLLINVQLARVTNDLGHAYKQLAKIQDTHHDRHYKSALGCFSESLKIREEINRKHFDTPTFLQNIASCYEEKRNYETALIYYNQALELIGKLRMEKFDDKYYILLNIAKLYNKRKEHCEAEGYAKRAYTGLNESLSMHKDTAAALLMLAVACFNQRKTVEAKQYQDKCLEMYEQLMSEGRQYSNQDWIRLQELVKEWCTQTENEIVLSHYQKRFEAAEKKYDKKLEELKQSKSDAVNTSTSTESSPDGEPGWIQKCVKSTKERAKEYLSRLLPDRYPDKRKRSRDSSVNADSSSLRETMTDNSDSEDSTDLKRTAYQVTDYDEVQDKDLDERDQKDERGDSFTRCHLLQ